MSDRPVLVIGAGAIGAIVAARVSAAGTPVAVAVRSKESARELAKRGCIATDQDGSTVSGVVAPVTTPKELAALSREGPCVAILATKCADATAALATWLPALPADCSVVEVQNGVMGDELAAVLRRVAVPADAGSRVSAHRLRSAAGGTTALTLADHASGGAMTGTGAPPLLACTVAFPATLTGIGTSVQTGPGGFHVGPWPTGPTSGDALHIAASTLALAGPVHRSSNMLGVKWTKLLINSCITSLGVATGTELGPLLRERRARQAFLAIVGEGYRAGLADGVKFEPVSGFRARLFAAHADAGPLSTAHQHVLLNVLARKYRRHRSSSLQSLERGAKTEVAYLNGRIVATATRHGVPAPVNQAIVALVEEIEAGRRRPSLDNLAHVPVRG